MSELEHISPTLICPIFWPFWGGGVVRKKIHTGLTSGESSIRKNLENAQDLTKHQKNIRKKTHQKKTRHKALSY